MDPYGGDYNPEQWSKDVWGEDHRLFTKAGTDMLTVGMSTCRSSNVPRTPSTSPCHTPSWSAPTAGWRRSVR
ncbi:beta-galactosidase [Streptomyces sp. NPDC056682]|uniref:beta-galactosidase n=1 Tax=Streptomyces sp. NPDC056682 TaxID=3345909 RepID=UPI003694D946